MAFLGVPPEENLVLEISQSSLTRFKAREPDENIVTDYLAKICIYDDETEDFVDVGVLDYFVIDTALAHDNRVWLGDALDAHSDTLADLFGTIYDEQTELKQVLMDAVGDDLLTGFGGILYLNRVELQPAYRGRDIGLQAIYTLLKNKALGCELALLQAAPIQDGKAAPVSDAERKKISTKLRRHYKRLNFVSIGRTGYMGASLNYHLPAFWMEP
ncbi:uncharacterized protein NMK_1985 [Novimethylophilus kurashikiensis]|uniref:N-acetyltransferase domain-containing protein n=1 Tax=Novimethylophilus kurashikiensis TaxID=1825523 RepID=A0A2R5F838_9PROT|nr:hypothetical protein [Novimethylophilus kurashikiensis]GBG14386.1 uncharacterized protein NMK_1985 [Novimethylophilus kurashikiensis]